MDWTRLLAWGAACLTLTAGQLACGSSGSIEGAGGQDSTGITNSSSGGGTTNTTSAGGSGGTGGGDTECGDGITEGDELCDGDCPTDCDDMDACTADSLMGSAATCDAVCANDEITACNATSDGCCPAGCDITMDPDCAPRVLMVHRSDEVAAVDLQTQLMGTGDFDSIDIWDVQLQGGIVPTAMTMGGYEIVFAWTDGGFGSANQAALGDALADYFDAGGRVVTGTYAYCSNGTLEVEGRWMTGGYTLMENSLGQTNPTMNQGLGTVNEPSSPLMANVNTFTAVTGFRCRADAKLGTTVVAEWTLDPQNPSFPPYPLVIRGQVAGRNRVDLNFYPPRAPVFGNGWSGDGISLIRNALLFE